MLWFETGAAPPEVQSSSVELCLSDLLKGHPQWPVTSKLIKARGMSEETEEDKYLCFHQDHSSGLKIKTQTESLSRHKGRSHAVLSTDNKL